MDQWWEQAACATQLVDTDNDLFFCDENDPGKVALAKFICSQCPVKAQCFADIMTHETTEQRYGIVGGYTAKERTSMYRSERSVRASLAREELARSA